MQKISMGLVFVALLVTAPRLTLAFLTGDGIAIPQHIEVMLLTATGVGSGVVLTVGNAILAHALAQKAHHKGLLWYVLLLAWLCFLLSAIVVVSPTLVAGLRKSSLVMVLTSASAQWFWAITAVAVVEVLVGAAISASILETEQPALSTTEPTALGRLGNALLNRLEQTIAPDPTEQPAAVFPENGQEPTAAVTNTQRKQLRQQALMGHVANGESFDIPTFAEEHQVSPQTVYRDLKELQEKMAQVG
ncbi:MAG TPA: DeoR family transcriptional regulator [Caldilineaceae bacterium]|nr:DeoR family transcriptional regulator [Caldilineaceae bacterium]